jgi:hypothetical protein
MGDARGHTAGGVTKACPLSGSIIGADRSRTAEQLGGTTNRPGRLMGGDRHVGGLGRTGLSNIFILITSSFLYLPYTISSYSYLHQYYSLTISTLTYISSSLLLCILPHTPSLQ